MKKLFYTCLLSIGAIAASAQCTPIPPSATGQFSPDVMPDIIKNTAYSEFTSFVIPPSINVAGTHTVDSILFLSVTNLPSGIVATFNQSDNKYNGNEIGCVQFSGTTSAATGTYTLVFNIRPWIDHNPTSPGDVTADQAGLVLDLVVKNPNAVDNIAKNISNINIAPNPFSKFAEIEFTAEKNEKITISTINMLGALMSKTTVDAKEGANSIKLERNNLPSGVYFVVFNNGHSTVSKKVIITE